MNQLERKQMILQSYKCANLNCSQEETLHHLFLDCPFANACRDIVCSERTKNMAILETFLDIKEKLNVPFFMEIIILAAWSIWIIRNNKVFKIMPILLLKARGLSTFKSIE
jgi:hypothetical protein